MRATPIIALLALLLTVGCAASTDEPAPAPDEADAEGAARDADTEGAGDDAGQEDTEVHTYPTGGQITVELTMYASEDRGRHTPFFSGFRPTVAFDHPDLSVTCAVQLPAELEQFAPGETHLVALECEEEVTVHVDEPGFLLIEGGKENGEGVVVFTDA